jgi:hypothetical protein
VGYLPVEEPKYALCGVEMSSQPHLKNRVAALDRAGVALVDGFSAGNCTGGHKSGYDGDGEQHRGESNEHCSKVWSCGFKVELGMRSTEFCLHVWRAFILCRSLSGLRTSIK